MMQETYRQLQEEDAAEYYDVLHRSYQTDRQYPISFSAIDATLEDEIRWLQQEPTYGLFVEGKLISAISLRMPWGGQPGPKALPHIGQFITDPDFTHQGYAKKLLHWVEEEVLKKQLKAPAVTLGTADTHPWLKTMYLHLGFRIIGERQLPGKKHKTIYFQKDVK